MAAAACRLSLLKVRSAPSGAGKIHSGKMFSSKLLTCCVALLMARAGTGSRAPVVPRYQIGGKTGTVHKVSRRGYAKDRYRSGYLPALRRSVIPLRGRGRDR